MILKEYKKSIYVQTLVSCNPMEEGFILEHLVYLSFDEGEHPFIEKINISKSYEVDQVYCCSKIYLDDEFDTNYEEYIQLFDESKEKFINSLFEVEKNYHLYFHIQEYKKRILF